MISRFQELFATNATPDPIEWPSLFDEFSVKRPFLEGKHPGWSPAIFDPPERSLSSCQKIFALVLDYDNKTKSGDLVKDQITLEAVAEQLADYYGFVHTTRHHTKHWPRFRVILPLTRPVSKMEYTAIWHKAAKLWPGLDKQPKDPSRFWYTPGVADHEGADFECLTLQGAYLDPDQFMDSEETPQPAHEPSSSTLENRARAYLEKMPASISGAGGHDALWAAARKLICDFGLDEQATFRILTSEFNPRCQPPWTEKEIKHKVESASNQARVKNPIVDRPLARASQPPQVHEAIVTDANWQKHLKYNAKDEITKDVGNVALILKNAPGFAGSLTHDQMTQRSMWLTEPQYTTGLTAPHAGEVLDDHHAVYVQHVLAFYYQLSVGKDLVWAALEAAAHENSVHPVQQYFAQIPNWDGKPRLRSWLHKYVGCDDTEYNAAIGRWWMISAVARAFRPGCQADHVLILEGSQGAGKSQAIRKLGGQWTLGSLPDIRDRKEAAETISGYWVVEIAELDALKGASMTRIKEFVSQQFDVYRKAYGRATVSRPRNCVFVGTTNEQTYLSDPTGARRFWPATVKTEIDLQGLERDRDQLWAETKAAFDAGEQWYPERSYIPLLNEEQSARYIEDDWTGLVAKWIESNITESGFTIDDILRHALMIEPRFWDRASATRIGGILTKLGYARKRVTEYGKRSYRYFATG